ncbi:MAG TPA: cell division protein FtsK, partial [Firmicutes bacterium]|nr:cell division protein FtsK [Bacillota bacterium]
NTLILSILFKAAPEEVKFLLIDPKVVELSVFNGIPHLMAPVVTDSKKAASALRWAVQEMEKRYLLFAAAGVREIKRYNDCAPEGNRLPYIVVIIDELADLMMVAPGDVEDAICRLAQMARAAGIHLVLATQRPSVDVITGIIKANIPSRISFAVSSQVDSRTILDMAGAEKLLGKGDMLFYPVGAPKPHRVQGAFVSDGEVEDVVAYTKRQAEPEFAEDVFSAEQETENEVCDEEDELLDDAIRLVLDTGQASISMLQRRFRIGYSRAARLIDMMEQMRIVGPNIGSKAREIIATAEVLQARLHKK